MKRELLIEKNLGVKHKELHYAKLEPKDGIDMEKLVGTPHIFGRFFNTRGGFQIEPIGVMTLQEGGGIKGYSHPNEGTWEPYKHGTVGQNSAFAFLSRYNKWIPSSTWQQSLGDIPIGYFCDEPVAPQKLCLVPQRMLPPEVKIVYLISSCSHYYKEGRTIPRLISQLLSEAIPEERIKILVNGCSDNYDRRIDGIDYSFSTHNAWEWSALYEAPLRWNFDYAMLVHDTCEIYPGFRRKVEEINGYLFWDYMPAAPLARCLIGLYSYDFLERLNPWLKSIDGIDKKNGVIAEAAGELLLRARTALIYGDPEHNGGARPAEWRETIDIYGTGSPRVRRVFPAINLHKFIHTGPSNPTSL